MQVLVANPMGRMITYRPRHYRVSSLLSTPTREKLPSVVEGARIPLPRSLLTKGALGKNSMNNSLYLDHFPIVIQSRATGVPHASFPPYIALKVPLPITIIPHNSDPAARL